MNKSIGKRSWDRNLVTWYNLSTSKPFGTTISSVVQNYRVHDVHIIQVNFPLGKSSIRSPGTWSMTPGARYVSIYRSWSSPTILRAALPCRHTCCKGLVDFAFSVANFKIASSSLFHFLSKVQVLLTSNKAVTVVYQKCTSFQIMTNSTLNSVITLLVFIVIIISQCC